jgi:GTPase SAR1 family protein
MSGKEDQISDHIEVSGSGAAATHGGVAAGAGGVAVGQDVYGNITVIAQGENVRDKELAYLDGLLARHEYWRDHYTPLAGIAEVRAAVQDGPRLDLPMPFIPPEFEKLVEHGYGERVEMKRVPVDDLREAVAEHRRIILLGEPGSGKTTTLWRLAYDYATAARADGQAPLPVLVPLGGYTDDGPFDAYLARYLGPLASYLETYRASRRLILLLDGLNEMPQAGYEERVGRIREVLDRQPDDVVVVTCRALDYVVKLEGLQKVEVSPLDEGRIRTFLHNYLGETAGERLFWTMAGGEEVRELWDTWQRGGRTWMEFWTWDQYELWRHRRKELPPLLALGRNPYLLLMTAQVYAGAGGDLPANRAQLFAAFVDTLLGREKKRSSERWIEAELQKDGLAALAYAMQAERGRGTTVEREWALDRLGQAVPGCDTERLLYLASSATLLDADETKVRFYHQLLQEYFAACYLVQLPASEVVQRFELAVRRPWAQTLQFAVEQHSEADKIVNELLEHPDDAFGTVLRLIARCIVNGAQVSTETRSRVGDRLAELWTSQSWTMQRDIGELIADGFIDPLPTYVRALLEYNTRWLQVGGEEIVAACNDPNLTRTILKALLDQSLKHQYHLHKWQSAVDVIAAEALEYYIERVKAVHTIDEEIEPLASLIRNLSTEYLLPEAYQSVTNDTTLPHIVRLAGHFLGPRPLLDDAFTLVDEIIRAPKTEEQHGITGWRLAVDALWYGSNPVDRWRAYICDRSLPEDRRHTLLFTLLDSPLEETTQIAMLTQLQTDDSLSSNLRNTALLLRAYLGDSDAMGELTDSLTSLRVRKDITSRIAQPGPGFERGRIV